MPIEPAGAHGPLQERIVLLETTQQTPDQETTGPDRPLGQQHRELLRIETQEAGLVRAEAITQVVAAVQEAAVTTEAQEAAQEAVVVTEAPVVAQEAAAA